MGLVVRWQITYFVFLTKDPYPRLSRDALAARREVLKIKFNF